MSYRRLLMSPSNLPVLRSIREAAERSDTGSAVNTDLSPMRSNEAPSPLELRRMSRGLTAS
jgi:hypothetical protein